MSPQVTAAVIAASVSFLTLIGTLAAQYFGRRATSRDTQNALQAQSKQLDRTLAEQRTRTLNERFAAAAGQLGSDKPPEVRLAGVYAMAGLADDWEDNRQTCVDVLCGYLRMPYEPDPGEEAPAPERLAFLASREVRHTVIRVIAAHLKAGAAVSWTGLNFDFTGVVFDGGDFGMARFSGIVLFIGAVFSGSEINFSAAVFSAGVIFRDAEFSGGTVYFTSTMFSGGEVDFGDAVFSGGKVDFGGAKFSGGTVYFTSTMFSGGEVDFGDAVFSGGQVNFYEAVFSSGEVDFSRAQFSGGQVGFGGAKFSGGEIGFGGAKFSGGTVDFSGAVFSGATVDFSRAQFSGATVDFRGGYLISAQFSGGEVDFGDAVFSGGKVDFGGAQFSGATVDFGRAQFSGGTVDFSDAVDWSFAPTFPWTDMPSPGVKLPQENQSRA